MTEHGPGRARELWRLLEPIHAVTYFSPEPLASLKAAGYRGFWMGYFAGRAAPLGPASAELVHAVFYNFTFGHVSRAIPDAWAYAPPEAALDARLVGSVVTLRRMLGDRADSLDVARAAELASKVAGQAPLEGRPLAAANRTVPEPEEPLARLWQAATLLREHRGDGHVASLAANGIGGRESHVFHALTTGTPAEVYEIARNMDSGEWTTLVTGLRDRGLVSSDAEALSDEGRRVKQTVEAATDALAWPAFDILDDAELDELAAALRPIAAAVVSSGEIPIKSPMGLDLAE